MTSEAEKAQLIPVETASTNTVIPCGHAGSKPLPISRFEGGYASAWVIPRKILKRMMREDMAISLVLAEDGSISMSALPVQLMKTQ